MTSGSRVPSGCTRVTTTFFSVAAAVYPASGNSSLATATSVSMVGVAGVSSTCASGSPSNGIDSGTTVRTASTLAAYPPAERTKVSSPIAVGCRNSSLFDPPIAPDIAETIT
jgi:hypothetical protein